MFKFIKLLLISLCFVSSISFAEDEPKSVIVSGTGGTREIALNNAFRHAVEQAVGMMVSSESYVKNLKDIQDKIFLASNGFIEQYKVLTEDHDTAGYAVTISALVRQKQLKTAIGSTTTIALPLDGSSLFANQMLKEDKTKSYTEEIVRFLDDLVSNAFEYSYDKPEIEPVEGNAGSYNVILTNVNVYLKRDWLRNVSKYREKFKDRSAFNDATNQLDISDISKYIGVFFELKDVSGKTIASSDVQIKDNSNFYLYKILGINNDYYQYPNIMDSERKISIYRRNSILDYGETNRIVIRAIDSDNIAKISKVVISAVKIKDYGGKLPLYKGNGNFE